MTLLRPETRRFRPVLAFDVVDVRGSRPREKGRDHEAHALAGACGRKREYVLGTVVTEIPEPVRVAGTPSTDIHSLLCVHQAGVSDVTLCGPPRRSVQVIGVLHEFLRTPTGGGKKQADANKAPRKNDHFALEERLSNTRVLRRGIVPSPHDPRKRFIDAA